MKRGEALNKMIVLVANKFDGKYDRGGAPYIMHLLKVMHYVKSDDEERNIIAVGHDLIEDTVATSLELREMGFSERVINGIRAMTKVPGETNDEYMARIMANTDAIHVKLADLRHNSDIRRLKGVTEKDIARLVKYHNMYLTLRDLV